jgi:uncharacterized membrane protein (DUF485 family)
MLQLSPDRVRRILSDPGFVELSSARAKLRWGLSLLTLFAFFGFIILISAASKGLGTNIGNSNIPVGIAIFFGTDILVVCLTGFYVQRSNSRFDRLTRDIRQEWDQ